MSGKSVHVGNPLSAIRMNDTASFPLLVVTVRTGSKRADARGALRISPVDLHERARRYWPATPHSPSKHSFDCVPQCAYDTVQLIS